jgi:hypothetical protein
MINKEKIMKILLQGILNSRLLKPVNLWKIKMIDSIKKMKMSTESF